MKPQSWFVVTLPLLALGLGCPASAQERGVTDAQAPSPAAQPAPVRPPVPAAQQAVAPQPATPAEPSVPAERKAEPQGGALALLPPAPPPSLQSLADERRDRLRRRREAMLDAYGGRYGFMPPWFPAYDQGVERYRDALRHFYRQQRDYSRLQHDSWMDAICPWSKPQRDWSAQRSYLRQMEQLDRQELRDAYGYGRPFPYGGASPW